MKLGIRIAVALLCLIATLQGLSAVFSDNTEVVKSAEMLACQGACIRTLELERTPFAQRFVFQVSIEPLQTAAVKCERSLVLFGEYSCQPTEPVH